MVEAEKLANRKFVNIMGIITGSSIIASSQNIDDTDLFKILSTPGYICIESADLTDVTSVEEFNARINNAMYDSTLLDSGKRGSKRIGVIYDIPESMTSVVDFSGSNIREKYGVPYEMFTHVQDYSGPSVTWIAAGLSLPTEEVKSIYEKYKTSSAEVNKEKDSFFEFCTSLKGNSEDSMFNEFDNLTRSEQTDKKSADFFKQYGLDESDDDKS